MTRSFKLTALVAAVAIALVASLGVVWRASRHVPVFYDETVALDPDAQREACDAFVAEVTGLASDLHGTGRWQHVFSAGQINAWLALELGSDYPALVDGRLRAPRVAIRDGEATIACRYEHGPISVVLSLTVDAYLSAPNVLAVRIRSARAGALPVPLAGVLDAISAAAGELKLRLEWRTSHGDPVALITFGGPSESRTSRLALETVDLREGELFVAGTAGLLDNLAGKDTPSESTPGQGSGDSDNAQPLVSSAPKETRQE